MVFDFRPEILQLVVFFPVRVALFAWDISLLVLYLTWYPLLPDTAFHFTFMAVSLETDTLAMGVAGALVAAWALAGFARQVERIAVATMSMISESSFFVDGAVLRREFMGGAPFVGRGLVGLVPRGFVLGVFRVWRVRPARGSS